MSDSQTVPTSGEASFPKKGIDPVEVGKAIASTTLSDEVKSWLTGQTDYISQLINVYAEDPDTFGLHEDLRRDPNLILKTVLYSADTLYGYQQQYNKTIADLAEANGISFDDLADIPALLQDVTVTREREKVAEHLKTSGTLAIALMGSGASGKGTIGNRTGMKRAINYTTRPRRPSETHGVDYYYIAEMNPDINLDKDTGHNVVNEVSEDSVAEYEVGSDGQPVNYFDKYGPYLATVHRPGRAKHGTPVGEFSKHFDEGEKTIFFEHGPVQVQEVGEHLPEFIPSAKVLPVCILPPRTGILPLALRIAVRTYGDEEHKDTQVDDGYKIKDAYLESTIGLGQIEELAMTAKFLKGNKPLGIAYIVNDDLQEAIRTLQGLIA